MASFNAGTFTAPLNVAGTPQDLTITTGFQPKIIFIQSTTQPVLDTLWEEVFFQFGWAYPRTGTTPIRGSYQYGTRWSGLFNSEQSWALLGLNQISYVSGGTSWSGTVYQSVDLYSVDSTSYTLRWTYVNHVGDHYKYSYIAIGGDDVSCAFGRPSIPTSTGNQTIAHGLSSAPAFVMFATNDTDNAYIGFSGTGSIGFRGFTDGVRQGVTAYCDKGNAGVGVNPTLNRVYHRTDKCCAVLSTNTGALLAEAEIVSIDGTNIVINWTTTTSFTETFDWIAVTGVSAFVGSFNQATSAIPQSVDTTPITAEALFVQSFGMVAAETVQTNCRLSHGFSDGGSTQEAIWAADNNGISSSGNRRCMRLSRTGKSLYSAEPASATTNTLKAEGTIAFSANSLDIDWTTADSTQREWIFLAVGSLTPADNIEMIMSGGIGFNSGALISLFADISGIYTIVPGKTDDTYYDTEDQKIPNPFFKTGYIGG